MLLSKDSKEFLENLRLYLFSSGKNEQDIEEIIEELRDHLYESESKGKNIDELIGQTPKEYMSQLAGEMSFDFRSILKYISIIILVAFCYVVMGDAIRESLAYSYLELIGFPFVYMLSLLMIALVFRYVASTKISKTKERIVFTVLGFTSLSMFIALMFLNDFVQTPVIRFGNTGEVIAIVTTSLVFIGVSIWTRTWISIILPIILFLPEIILNFTELTDSTRIIIYSISMPVFLGIYFLAVVKKEKNCES